MSIQQGCREFFKITPRGLGEITSRLSHYRIGVNRGTLSKNTYYSFLKPSTLVAEIFSGPLLRLPWAGEASMQDQTLLISARPLPKKDSVSLLTVTYVLTSLGRYLGTLETLRDSLVDRKQLSLSLWGE